MIEEKKEAFGRLLTIMDELREQCPWDRKQTMESLATLTVEETYELIDEIEKGELTGIKEEIGDIMLHMVFYAKIGDEKGAFNIADSLNSVCDKLIRRHPHIYGDVNVEDDEEVKKNWERIKMSEKGKKSVFQGVPNALPAVIKAQRMQEKAAQVGFEWEQPEDVWAKVEEEIGELKEAIATTEIDKKTDEFGDVMFSLINFARFIGVDANRALDLTNRKFKARVEYIEQNSKKSLPDMTLEEMDILWERAKIEKV
ncbi:MAG: XTP/dITP diphosphohydrolase [Saprospiraceae bacterium]|jgi:XTP/dITP diphosphohydrolase